MAAAHDPEAEAEIEWLSAIQRAINGDNSYKDLLDQSINPAFFGVTAQAHNSWCEPNFQTGRPSLIAATRRSACARASRPPDRRATRSAAGSTSGGTQR